MELSVQQKLAQTGFSSDRERWYFLLDFARLTALKKLPSGPFHLGHWWRGPLLYSLVQRHHPRHILEFGTGRGYSALCMAKGALDKQTETDIWTIDRIHPSSPQPWDIDEGNGPQLKQLSLDQVWTQYFPSELTQRIHFLTGHSPNIMKTWQKKNRPPIDFCFIDGGHDYWSVRRDFTSALKITNPGCSFLLDDYVQRKNYGVQQFIDQDIAPYLPKEAIEVVDILAHYRTVHGEEINHKMVLLQGDHFDKTILSRLYSKNIMERLKSKVLETFRL